MISSLISLCYESRHCVISIILYLLKSVLWPRIWFTLVNIPCEFEKTAFCFCWIKQSIDIHYVLLTDGGVELNYAITDFLLAGSIHF